MWGEGASDLWGRLEEEDDEHDGELLEAVRVQPSSTASTDVDQPMSANVEAA